MDNNSLVIVEKLDAAVVFSEQGMTKLLDEIKIKVDAHDLDISTEDGRKDVVSLAYKITRSKTMIDDLGKGVVSEWKKKAKKIDEQRKIARDFLDDLKTKTRQPLTKWETEQEVIRLEDERKEKTLVQNRIDGLLNVGVVMSFADIAMMDKASYDVMLFEATAKYEAELARREEEQKAREVHEAKLAEIAKQQAMEAARLEGIRKEQEHQKKIIEVQTAKLEAHRLSELSKICFIDDKHNLGNMSALDYAELYAAKHAIWLAEQARKEEVEAKALEAEEIEKPAKPFDPMLIDKEELIKDTMILVGRLYLEDYDTCAPETIEVLERWKPIWEETNNVKTKI